LKNIFDLFTQKKQGYTLKFEGNGIGPAIVKKYADLNNCLIKTKSEKGMGPVFRVIIPKEILIEAEQNIYDIAIDTNTKQKQANSNNTY